MRVGLFPGLDDARNTARLAWHMMKDGCVMQITKTLASVGDCCLCLLLVVLLYSCNALLVKRVLQTISVTPATLN